MLLPPAILSPYLLLQPFRRVPPLFLVTKKLSSCRVVECTLTVRYVGTHSFKPRPTANPLSLDHRRALIFSRPNLGQAQYRFLETSGGCPHPRDKPGHHPYPLVRPSLRAR